MGLSRKHVWTFAAVVAAIVALLVAVPAFAAEFGGGDTYRLPAGQVIEDDLTVAAQEIYIDGTVDGDLVAVGAYIEINGVVTGDLLAAGAEVRINGVVEDDVRAAGAGVIVTGRIGDHLFAAAGGGEGALSPMQVNGRSVVQGVRLERGATVGGSAYIFGGEALIDGAVASDLRIGAGVATLNGQVGGDASLDVGKVSIGDTARVEGRLSYTAPEAVTVPPGVAGDVRFEQREQPQTAPAPAFRPGQILRPLLMLAGFALLGWLLLRFTPEALRRPAQAGGALRHRRAGVAICGAPALRPDLPGDHPVLGLVPCADVRRAAHGCPGARLDAQPAHHGPVGRAGAVAGHRASGQ